MLSLVDTKFFDQANVDPTGFIGRMIEFQRAGIAAASEIAENTSRGLLQLASVRDPQEFFTAQQTILQEIAQQNFAVLTRLGQITTVEEGETPAAGRKASPKKTA